jgi:nitrate/nitrite-specific signal transduction histidine kinase
LQAHCARASGDFEITSEAGKGTTVRITLPESEDDSELIGANEAALMKGL